MSPPVRGGALSIDENSSGVRVEVGHGPFYASIGRPRVETIGIASINVNSLIFSLIAYIVWI